MDLDEFSAFVVARSPALMRSAWLLTGNDVTAQDLLQAALTKTWIRWPAIRKRENAEAYVRTVMLSLFLSWRRRRWNSELPFGTVPDHVEMRDDIAAANVRTAVVTALGSLPRRQRAVIALRFYEDMTEADTAAALNVAVGTVKSQTAKALASLRRNPALTGLLNNESHLEQLPGGQR